MEKWGKRKKKLRPWEHESLVVYEYVVYSTVATRRSKTIILMDGGGGEVYEVVVITVAFLIFIN